jgi:CHAT domain-containing protein
MEPAEALRQAQLSFVRSGQSGSDLPAGWAQPHVWGAFAYYGA